MAEASEDCPEQATNNNLILQAIQNNQPRMLQRKAKSHLKNKKALANMDMNLIRSDGRKRKFFLKDSDIKKNLL